jgi:hypothetical protein
MNLSKNQVIVASVIALGLLTYFLWIKPTQEAKKACLNMVGYKPATQGQFGESEHYAFGLGKYKTREDAMESCVSYWKSLDEE